MVRPLLGNVTLLWVEHFSASGFWQEVRASAAPHIHFLGGILQILLKQPPSALDREHGARIAWGGGCPREIWRLFEERFGTQIRECYGMTECSSITTFNDNGTVGAGGKPAPWLAVEDCAMIGVAAEIGEQDIKLFVKRRAGATLTPAELSGWLAERLAPYQNPRYIVMLDDFERTASQRIMKHKLAALTAAAFDRM